MMKSRKKVFGMLFLSALLLLCYRWSPTWIGQTKDNSRHWYDTSKTSNHDFTASTQLDSLSKTLTKREQLSPVSQHKYSANVNGVDKVLNNVAACLEVSNMVQTVNEKAIALDNARYFYEEYRKVIPSQFLPDYNSHCWRMHFNVTASSRAYYRGHLGSAKITGGISLGAAHSLYAQLEELLDLHNGHFSTEVVCLPSVFIIGFPKCGSTYLWCVVKALVRLAANVDMYASVEVAKEPHFWVKGNPNGTTFVRKTEATHIADYLLNILPGLDALKTDERMKSVPFVDGSPNVIFNWPLFSRYEPPNVNYCLLPSVLPELLPMSKFIVILRDPIDMLYSAFWYSCSGLGLSREAQEKVPQVFHQRAKAKISQFLHCMVDETHPNPCTYDEASAYDTCIRQRLHLLDTCVTKAAPFEYEDPMPSCGKVRLRSALFYTHVRKWLAVVSRDNMHFVSLERLHADLRAVATSLLEFLGYQLQPDLLDKLKEVKCFNEQKSYNYKNDPKLLMRKETKHVLKKFFEPFNILLAEQTEKISW